MPNYTLRRKRTVASKDHGLCATCGKDILKGQALVTLSEFDYLLKRSGRVWKRHEGCPMVDVEYTRLSDKAGKIY